MSEGRLGGCRPLLLPYPATKRLPVAYRRVRNGGMSKRSHPTLSLAGLGKVLARCPLSLQTLWFMTPSDIEPKSPNSLLTRRASDQARCIVRAEGLRERDAGCPRLVRKFRRVIAAAPSAFGKGWCRVGAAERHPARNAGLSRQSGWCSPVMEGNKCPTRHRHDSAKKRRGTPG